MMWVSGVFDILSRMDEDGPMTLRLWLASAAWAGIIVAIAWVAL